jgi:predicted nucleic-acid-binding Zn-ribbon protein
MKHSKQCPKCQSNDVIADVTAIDRSHNSNHSELSVATYRDPYALIFMGQQKTTLSAWVCANCGFVEFYADAPKKLKL